uniref:U34-Liphistoxin-Lsp1a_1 n=2 Tax=Liphistius TaxID=62150 RepID=A0A4Q8K5J8_9ARAC
MSRGLFAFLAAAFLLLATVTRGNNNGGSSHHLRKRSCLFLSEECTKDTDCCTFNCLCVGSDPCKCGKRSRPEYYDYPNGRIPSLSRTRSRSRKRVSDPHSVSSSAAAGN